MKPWKLIQVFIHMDDPSTRVLRGCDTDSIVSLLAISHDCTQTLDQDITKILVMLGLLHVLAVALVRNSLGNVVPVVRLAGDPCFVVLTLEVNINNVSEPLDKPSPSNALGRIF